VKAQTLFISTLGLSLLIHALILFGPTLPLTHSNRSTEQYRVSLVQKTLPPPSPVPSVPQERKSPPTETTETTIQDRPETKILENKEEQAMPQDREADDPQSQPQHDRIVEKKNSLPTPLFDHQASWGYQETITTLQPEQPDDHQRVLADLRRLLKDRLQYPEVARRKGIEGTVIIALTINADGLATDLAVSASSGSSILDRAALKAISDILPHPNPPDRSLGFTVPVIFHLTDSR
jgi:protein TonB